MLHPLSGLCLSVLAAVAPGPATSAVQGAAPSGQAEAPGRSWELSLDEVRWSGATTDVESARSMLATLGRDAWGPPASRVVLEDGGEAYVVFHPTDRSGARPGPGAEVRLVAHARGDGGDGPVRGTVIAGHEFQTPFRLTFELGADQASDEAHGAFLAGRAWHHAALVERSVPGSAWFRHGIAMAGDAVDRDALRTRWAASGSGELTETLQLFGGGRAVAENLQLDRLLPPALARADDAAPQPDVAVDTIPGISVEPFDWTPLLAEVDQVELDPLLAWIPHDQHVLLMPSFSAFVTLVDESEQRAGPLVEMLEASSVGARSQQALEEQLALSLDDLARLLGPALVERVAITGGDLYLRTGTDFTLLFDCRDAAPVVRYVRGRYEAVAAAADDVELVTNGSVEGVRSPYGRVSSYFTVEGNVLMVSNSRVSLERSRAAIAGDNLAALDETRFFRHRYPRVDADGREETAFLMISDATIRRWCGARWRLANSRRLRALAAMLEVQAGHVEALAAGVAEPRTLHVDDARFPDLGTVTLTAGGVHSSIYGTSGRLTPIVELELETVPAAEAQLYERWRDGYARNWSGAFDPIAARVVVTDQVVEGDLSVLPLIDNTDYRELRAWSGDARLSPLDGDPHPGTLFHFALAIDPGSPEVLGFQQLLTSFAPGEVSNVLGWMTGSVSLYADEDEVWDALGDAEDVEQAIEDLRVDVNDLPLTLTVGSASPLKLAAWMAAVRGFVEGSAPGSLRWSTQEDGEGNSYVRVDADDFVSNDEHLLYATLREAFVLSLNEGALLRTMKRYRARRDDPSAASRTTWLGESAAMTISRQGLVVLGQLLGETLGEEAKQRTYANLPILNEWRRLFPDQDPVAVHERLFGQRLACAAGGSFVWDDTWKTMSSTEFGHPAAPVTPPHRPPGIGDLQGLEAGLTFELDGLRARVRATR